MGALPPVPGVYRCTATGHLAGIPIATVFHLGYTGPPPTGQQALEVATGIGNSWSAHISPLQCSDVVMDTFTATDLSSETGADAVFEVTCTGSASGSPVPNQVQMVISKPLARRYRGGHPRTYLPGFPTADLASPTQWLSTASTNAANHWATFILGIISAPGVQNVANEVVVHYVKDHLPLPVPLVDAFVGATASTLIGTLRRRLT